ncbi:hypothetical protein KSS87_010899, partial [Heliosperma pusillum]
LSLENTALKMQPCGCDHVDSPITCVIASYVPCEYLKYQVGQIASKDVWSTVFNNMLTREMLYLYRSKNIEMEPQISPKDTLVIRRFPTVNSRAVVVMGVVVVAVDRSCSLPLLKEHLPQINVGDVVVLQDPSDSKNYIIRRLAAVEGYEMVSTNEDDEPFVLEEGQGWVLSDKKSLSQKDMREDSVVVGGCVGLRCGGVVESKDSRTFGPISMSDILGRIVYRFRTLDDHGFMVNNKLSMTYDMPVIYMELKTEEMLRFTDKGKQSKSS